MACRSILRTPGCILIFPEGNHGEEQRLRTPLTKLRLTLAMLKDVVTDLVAGAERNVIRIESMLGQFLDFARGFEAEETRAVPLRSLLQQAVEVCAERSLAVALP